MWLLSLAYDAYFIPHSFVVTGPSLQCITTTVHSGSPSDVIVLFTRELDRSLKSLRALKHLNFPCKQLLPHVRVYTAGSGKPKM